MPHTNRNIARALVIAMGLPLLVSAPAAAQTDWVQWQGNGHWYRVDYAPNDITWANAQAVAAEAGGYLVSLASSEENEFVFSLIDDPLYWRVSGNLSWGPWTGGIQPPGSPEPADGWTWVTGEELTFTNWWGGEPNNQGSMGAEDRIIYWGANETPRTSRWNDVSHMLPWIRAYVVERECNADFDGDGDTDQSDLASLLAVYGSCAGDPEYIAQFDIDGNGCVDQADLGIVLTNYGVACP